MGKWSSQISCHPAQSRCYLILPSWSTYYFLLINFSKGVSIQRLVVSNNEEKPTLCLQALSVLTVLPKGSSDPEGCQVSQQPAKFKVIQSWAPLAAWVLVQPAVEERGSETGFKKMRCLLQKTQQSSPIFLLGAQGFGQQPPCTQLISSREPNPTSSHIFCCPSHKVTSLSRTEAPEMHSAQTRQPFATSKGSQLNSGAP